MKYFNHKPMDCCPSCMEAIKTYIDNLKNNSNYGVISMKNKRRIIMIKLQVEDYCKNVANSNHRSIE